MFIVFRHGWGHLFNNDPEVVSLVAQILPLVALFQVFDGLAATTGGILRARGRQVRLSGLSFINCLAHNPHSSPELY